MCTHMRAHAHTHMLLTLHHRPLRTKLLNGSLKPLSTSFIVQVIRCRAMRSPFARLCGHIESLLMVGTSLSFGSCHANHGLDQRLNGQEHDTIRYSGPTLVLHRHFLNSVRQADMNFRTIQPLKYHSCPQTSCWRGLDTRTQIK